ncbi:CDP-glucose 4,6-dehydratase [Geobacter sp. OR-1]|uniref:CDP-glucose 4,6-dehydratase n=1 Tax=Geobacter sp. OR-1 TaxID=1266765 RepID=UPI0005A708BC|nr:CDP-glucose 4,6-dehydratase [Geobacter sp. OR-1]
MAVKEFWQGKKVFLTGHTGFKGSWLSIWLHSLGAKVTGYALDPPTDPSLFDMAGVSELLTSVIADVRDLDRLKAAMIAATPDIVIHMAAQPLVRDSYKIPVETYAINVMGTVHLLEAVRSCPSVRAVVNVTTDKVYENREWVWGYREEEPFGGYDPYSNSKGCSELVTAAYRSSYFNPAEYHRHGVAVASARAGNVIGGGDWAGDRLIPDIVRAIMAGEKVLIRNPHAIRPWQHVLEPLSGYLLLAQRLFENSVAYAEGWNFGPADDDARPVEWVVRELCSKWGNGAGYLIDDGEHPHEASYLKLDCSKARMRLGWRPRWDLATALDRIVAWTKEYIGGNDLRETCRLQIIEYGRGFDE